jgi:hypothetical protein
MPIKNHSETEKVKALGEQIAVKAKKSSSSFIDDECEWINDVVSCKKCREPVHIAFFHGSPITYCPKCKKMHGFPYEDLLVEKTRKGVVLWETCLSPLACRTVDFLRTPFSIPPLPSC